MRFSQREGYTPPNKAIQADGMDKDLRNSIWNCFVKCYFVNNMYLKMSEFPIYNKLYNDLWSDFFKIPINDLSNYIDMNETKVRLFFEDFKWYEVYDFIEFIVGKFSNQDINKKFMDYCNEVFAKEMSAYRFIGGKIMRSTTQLEIEEIESALTNTDTDEFLPVRLHLKQSLNLLTDRKQPDFRNSIKESISAVEALCKIILDEPKTTLGQALKKLDKSGGIHIHQS